MRALVTSVIAIVLFTAVFGFGYPALMTGFAQVAFPEKADGSLIERDGTVVGSRLAAQAFTQPEYFHPRPSAVEYNAAGTSFANLGPTSPDLAAAVDEQAQAILDLEGPYNPGLEIGDIPVDAVTTSGVGYRPAHLPGVRRAPGAARRRGARAAARARPRAGRRRHRGPLRRLPRRARRERARAQSGAGRGGTPDDVALREPLHARDRHERDPRLLRQARPAHARPQPRHLHRRGRQHRRLGDLPHRRRARRPWPGAALVHRRHRLLAVGHRPAGQLRGGHGGGARQGAGEGPARHAHDDRRSPAAAGRECRGGLGA